MSQETPVASAEQLASALKQGMRQWLSGVTVVTAFSDVGPVAMTASSLTSVSDGPASLLVCINQQTSMAQCLKNGTPVAVNILASEHEWLSNLCADPSKSDQRFSVEGWLLDGDAPVFKDSPACFEGCVSKIIPHGTHFVVIVDITGVRLAAADSSPLGYWNGGYRSIAK